jgi:membrane protease YdiL (CAAX protease family)
MSAESGGEAPVEPGDRPPRFNRWVTGVALGLLGALAVLVFWPSHGLDTLDRPEQSLERVVTREMDLRAAARTALAWERRLYALALSSDAAARADAIGWYDEIVRTEGSPLGELYRVVLLAEDGQTEAVQTALAAWVPDDDWAGRLAMWAQAAYGAEPPPPGELRVALGAIRRELPGGWFADRLVARLAQRLGDPATQGEAEQAVLARGTRLLWRLRAILAGEALLVAVAAAAAAPLVAAPGMRAARVAMASIPPSWSAGDGVGLFARGAVGLVGVAVLWPFLPDTAWSGLLISVLSAVPLCGYLLWYCRRSGATVAETFGLRIPRASLPALARATLALVGVSTLADVAIELGGARLGAAPHWTDGFQERLVWGTQGEVVVDVVDGVILAPIVEELLFRGVLYGTLRLRFGPLPATAASAALFALAHGYGVVGFVSVLASGVLWAIAYERTRSLLPGILTHAANNLQATAIVLATLRF